MRHFSLTVNWFASVTFFVCRNKPKTKEKKEPSKFWHVIVEIVWRFDAGKIEHCQTQSTRLNKRQWEQLCRRIEHCQTQSTRLDTSQEGQLCRGHLDNPEGRVRSKIDIQDELEIDEEVNLVSDYHWKPIYREVNLVSDLPLETNLPCLFINY